MSHIGTAADCKVFKAFETAKMAAWTAWTTRS